MTHTIRFKFISIILVIALIAQIFPSAEQARLQAAQQHVDTSTATGRLLDAFGLLETAVPASPQAAPSDITADCHSLYLPIVVSDNSISAQTASRESDTLASPATLAGPAIAIINPADGWTVSGMMWFAVQSIDPVSSVTFTAGTTDLGTDATPEDGFKVFLDASSFPTGTLQLSATASNPCGQTTETITVNVVPHPPSSGTIGSEGGVLASEIDSIITIRPGAVPDGTSVTVDEKTQEEITLENGFDWDAMGVTFLGAQAISSTAPFSLPLGVASAGFGTRVQPGQAVVNYSILPDANGDSVDELVILNTASVAPNEDVISDPVPQLALAFGEIQLSTRSRDFLSQNLQNGISGPPGTFFEINAIGFNPFSALGNVAIYQSSVDNTELRMPLAIINGFGVGDIQTLLTMIPSLPPGPATLELRNESTSSTLGPFDITVETPAPLTKPPEEIIDEFLVAASNNLDDLANILAGEDAFAQTIRFIDLTNNEISTLRPLIQDMSIEPELEDVLVNMAVIIENAQASASFSTWQTKPMSLSGNLCDNKDAVLETLDSPWLDFFTMAGLLGAASLALALGAPALAAAAGVLFAADAFFAITMPTAMSVIMIDCFRNKPLPPQSIYSSPLFFEGMGAAPPSGGNGAGNALVPPTTRGTSNLRLHSSSFYQEPGRVIVKVASAGGAGFPFSGATDAGGYFFIPLIPQGEPFVATAIDTLTGQMRTFEGVGPPVGGSVIMAFDFFSGDSEGVTELQFGEVVSASIDSPTEIDTFSFQGMVGDGIFLRMKGIWSISDPDCCHYPAFEVYRPDGTLLCSNPPVGVNLREETCILDATGTYILLYSDYGSDDTGDYQLFLQRINPPAMATEINFGQTVTGTLDFLVKLGAHTFNGTIGDRILFRMSEASASQNLQPKFWIFRPDGTALCDAFSTSSHTEVEETCILDANGTYSILAGGWAAQSLSPYALYLQRLNNPSLVTPTAFGEVKSGTLDIFAKADTYQFDGTSGDQIIVRMVRTATLPSSPYAFWPMFRLYREDGTELCSAFGGTLAETICMLDLTGPYTILASNRQGLGSYNLFIQRTNNPASPTPITYGETITDTIGSFAEQDAYTFSGTAGNQVLFRMTKISGNLDPQFGVYRPDGSLLCSAQASFGVAEAACTLDTNGNYAILAGDRIGTFTGDYQVFIDLN